MRRGFLVPAVCVLCAACAARAPAPAVTRPPSPPSVTQTEPGGDADDPHRAALERLVSEGWGWRNDRQDALHVPMPDWKNWRRVRFWGLPSFAGFRYGDAHHAVLAVWVTEAPAGAEATPAACLDRFEEWAAPIADGYGVELGPVRSSRERWGKGEVVVKWLDAEVSGLLGSRGYAVAYTAYAMWPGTCTAFGVAVPFRGQPALARSARDRYVKDGFGRMDQHKADRPDL